MIIDEKICEDCRYNDINSYSLKERHCKKCDNYGEKVLKADVTIFQKPISVRIDCPHCDWEIDIDYNEFEDLMPGDYPGDWSGTEIECTSCGKRIEIDDYSWD